MKTKTLVRMIYRTLLGSVIIVCAEFHAEAVEIVDPTKPPAEVLARSLGEDGASASVLLHGVKQDGKASFAILNDTFVKIGQAYKGYRLISVYQDHVILEDEAKQRLTLSMNLGDFKKSPMNGNPPVKTNKWQQKSHKAKNH